MQYLLELAGRFERRKFEDPVRAINPLSECSTDRIVVERTDGRSTIRSIASRSIGAVTRKFPACCPGQSNGGSNRRISHQPELSGESDASGQSGACDLGSPLESEDENDTHSVAVLNPAAENTPFVITSPPRSGRPKQIARVKKAARKKVISAAAEDTDTYYSDLSLASVKATLAIEATYESSAAPKGCSSAKEVHGAVWKPGGRGGAADGSVVTGERNPACVDKGTDDTIKVVMTKLFGSRNDVIVVSPDVIGSFGGVVTSVTMRILADAVAGVKNGKI
ncbi:hypothetical protein JG687_00015170 [Phytophthora cactorum]|uniref:Uncharacterized protein n=1 Tax=Phytophthora cactorum TaxID=29920 RepID=A0A8T1TV95_9STRA|nr:hypothetical protein JG687_00015170 [Phytophthora cactorum]